MIELVAGSAQAAVLAEVGAGLASLAVDGRPVLRAWSGRIEDGPFAQAMNLLAPFSNRISGGGFTFRDRFHPLVPNLPGEAFPIHGDAFQKPWDVIGQASDRALLRLADGRFGPFSYVALAGYRLTRTALTVSLTLTSTAAEALPFGLGFHPWFPRREETRIRFSATGMWPEDDRHLPVGTEPEPLVDGGNWHEAAPLPDEWINTGFAGWDQTADIRQPAPFQSVRLVAEGATTALFYSPSRSADFFCFEPVSHPVDAHNLPGLPGLTVLAPGEAMSIRMSISWDATP